MDTCDRCGPYTKAATMVIVRSGILTLCRHCADVHSSAMAANGYTIMPDLSAAMRPDVVLEPLPEPEELLPRNAQGNPMGLLHHEAVRTIVESFEVTELAAKLALDIVDIKPDHSEDFYWNGYHVRIGQWDDESYEVMVIENEENGR